MSRQRYAILDLLRGLLFINMVAYHGLYDWVYLFDLPCPFLESHGAWLWQQSICSGFILLAGCCATLSRHPAKRGMQLVLCALLVTVTTWLIMPQERILFGILHLMGASYLLTALLHPLLDRLPRSCMLLLSLPLFAFTRGIYYGYVGFLDHAIWMLPDSWYQYDWLFWLGLPAADFFSSDYFPLVPWFFLFLAGYQAAPLVLHSRFFQAIQHWQLPPVNQIGRHTLLLYLLHQPVLYGVLSLFTMLF